MVPFLDLKAQYERIRPEIAAAVMGVLESGEFVLGKAVADFEGAFAKYCGAAHAVGVNSGTSALHLALAAAGIGPGDEVITVSSTFVATVAAIEYAGATPVLVDVDPVSLTMDPAHVEVAITEHTRAILPVHLHGETADMDPILELAGRRGLTVIEDAAQAHGARYKGRPAGSLGHLAGFSFYPGKNLGAYGEGGAVVTGDAGYAGRIRTLRDWGQEGKYNHVHKGFNYRMDGIQGAVLGVKMHHIEAWTEARRRHAEGYRARLSGLGITIPQPREGCRHVYHVYAVRVPDRERVQDHLREAGVATGIHYPVPVHLQPAYARPEAPPGSLPVTERAARELLSLPMFPELTEAQIDHVCQALADAL